MVVVLHILFIGFILLMALAFEWQTQWMSRLSVFTLFFLGLLKFGIGLPLSEDVNLSVNYIDIGNDKLVQLYVATVLAYIGVFVGILLTRMALRGKTTPTDKPIPTTVELGAIWSVAVPLMALVAFTWIVLPWDSFVAAWQSNFAIGHSATDYFSHRFAYGDLTSFSSSGLNYLGSLARFGLMPFVVWILYFLRTRSRGVNLLFWLAFSLLIVIGLASGQKQPALLLLLGFYVAYTIVRARGIFDRRMFLAALIGVAIVLPVLYHFQYPQFDYPALIQQTLFRAVVSDPQVAQLYFFFYPDVHPFLNGQGSYIVRVIEQSVGFDVSNLQSPDLWIPMNVPYPTPGAAWPAGFFADAWANLGWLGVVSSSIFVGAYLQVVKHWFQHGAGGPLERGAYVAVCFSALWLTEVSLTTALLTYGGLSGFAVYKILKMFPVRLGGPDMRAASIALATKARQTAAVSYNRAP